MYAHPHAYPHMQDPPPPYDGRSLMAIALALRDDMTSLFAEKNAEIAQRDATILALHLTCPPLSP